MAVATLFMLVYLFAYSGGETFHPCPTVEVASKAEFWKIMSENPMPRIISGFPVPTDFVGEMGAVNPETGSFEWLRMEVPSSEGYKLTDPGFDPKLVREMKKLFPMPEVARSVDLRPIVSVASYGTGETNIAHHYHSVTVMLLLQGEKIWILSPPSDKDCAQATNGCTDPLDVCAHYAREGGPVPACVQRPGDLIVVPDAWYHGTCNNASWTVGWGGQGRRVGLLAGAPKSPFMISAEPVLTSFVGAELLDTVQHRVKGLGREGEIPSVALDQLWPTLESVQMQLRSWITQYNKYHPQMFRDDFSPKSNNARHTCKIGVADGAALSEHILAMGGGPELAHVLVPLKGTTLRVEADGADSVVVAPLHGVVFRQNALANIIVESSEERSDSNHMILICEKAVMKLKVKKPRRTEL